MKSSVASAARLVLDLLFPSRCIHCGADGSLLCSNCTQAADRLDGAVCRKCALPLHYGNLCSRCAEVSPALDRMIAVFQMEGAIREAVHALKYDDLRAIAPVLAEEMSAHPSLARMSFDAVLPVPLHPARLRERGFNQAELLARGVAQRLSKPVDTQTLRRRVNTSPLAQAASEGDRRRAVQDAFEVTKPVAGGRFLLIDDVATTGSTLETCATTLKSSGAAWVGGLVLAREI